MSPLCLRRLANMRDSYVQDWVTGITRRYGPTPLNDNPLLRYVRIQANERVMREEIF